MLLLISEASMVCVTIDVTDATTTTVPVMATSILLWAFISLLARLRRVEEASPGDPGRFLLSFLDLGNIMFPRFSAALYFPRSRKNKTR